eukprot:2551639-Amphidinium_carterae.5
MEKPVLCLSDMIGESALGTEVLHKLGGVQLVHGLLPSGLLLCMVSSNRHKGSQLKCSSMAVINGALALVMPPCKCVQAMPTIGSQGHA